MKNQTYIYLLAAKRVLTEIEDGEPWFLGADISLNPPTLEVRVRNIDNEIRKEIRDIIYGVYSSSDFDINIVEMAEEIKPREEEER